MSEARLETLADAVLDAWASGAQVDFATAGGDPAICAELAGLERAAAMYAAIGAMRSTQIAPMRPAFFEQLVAAGNEIAKAPALPPHNAPLLGNPVSRQPRWLPFLVGAAAGFLGAYVALSPADGEPPSRMREEFLGRGNYAKIDWKPGTSHSYGTVHGDVVWCTQRQQGFLRIDGLQPLPQGLQYQLWIVDADRTGAPVDGGLFDLASGNEQVVPIHAKLPVREAKAFVVTVEKKGGVVVSEQKDVVAIAGI